MYYTFQPLADLSQTHNGWYIWGAIALTLVGIIVPKLVAYVKAGDDDGVITNIVLLILLGIVTWTVHLGSYRHTKPENTPYRATFQGYKGSKESRLYVVYRLDDNGHEILKEVRPDVAYPKHVILYKNKNNY